MPPQMPPNPFLGAARGMMQPPLPTGPVSIPKNWMIFFQLEYQMNLKKFK